MTATAEAYGFGARSPYAEPRASEYDMKQRARLSGLFPRVRNEPLSKQLQKLQKEFGQNAALTGIMERRRRQEERMQYELQGREGMRALEMNRTPNLRAGMAPIATRARVAAAIAELPPVPPPEDAAAVMAGNRRRRQPRPEDAPAVPNVAGQQPPDRSGEDLNPLTQATAEMRRAINQRQRVIAAKAKARAARRAQQEAAGVMPMLGEEFAVG